MSNGKKTRCSPRLLLKEMELIKKAATANSETPAGFMRRWSLKGARIELKILEELS